MTAPITLMPPAPLRSNPAGYPVTAEAFMVAIENLVPEMNLQNAENNLKHAETLAAAEVAYTSAGVAAGVADYMGEWAGLLGTFPRHSSVTHMGSEWLAQADIPDVTTAVPGVDLVWQLLEYPNSGETPHNPVGSSLTGLTVKEALDEAAGRMDLQDLAAVALEEQVVGLVAEQAGLLDGLVSNISGTRRNLHINGACLIAQRATSFVSPASGTHTLDGFQWLSTMVATVTITQAAEAPSAEFLVSHKVRVTAADAALTASDYAMVRCSFEGRELLRHRGRTFTASFHVFSSRAGLHTVSFRNSAGDASYVASFLINAANTWEKKSVTVVGGIPVAGTWNFSTGAAGLHMDFAMAGGTAHQTADTSQWVAGNFLTAAGAVNLMDSVDNVLNVTGIQLEPGEVARAFEHQTQQGYLTSCQRFRQMAPPGWATGIGTTQAKFVMALPTPLAGAAQATLISGLNKLEYAAATYSDVSALESVSVGEHGGHMTLIGSALVVGRMYYVPQGMALLTAPLT